MKIAVLSYAGNVGKTTLVSHFLKRRFPEAEILAIDTINESAEGLGLEVSKIPGGRFQEIFSRILRLEHAILDVGASNIENFMLGMADFEGAHQDIDLFLIPTTPDNRIQGEAVKMVAALRNQGVTDDRIRILLNRAVQDPEVEFEFLRRWQEKDENFPFDTRLVVLQNQLFDILARRKRTLDTLLTDESVVRTALNAAIKAGDEKRAKQLADEITHMRLACGVKKNFDYLAEILFGEAS